MVAKIGGESGTGVTPNPSESRTGALISPKDTVEGSIELNNRGDALSGRKRLTLAGVRRFFARAALITTLTLTDATATLYIQNQEAAEQILGLAGWIESDEQYLAIEGCPPTPEVSEEHNNHYQKVTSDLVAGPRKVIEKIFEESLEEDSSKIEELSVLPKYAFDKIRRFDELTLLLREYKNYPQLEITSPDTGITYAIYSNEKRAKWLDYIGDEATFPQRFVQTVESTVQDFEIPHPALASNQKCIYQRHIENKEFAGTTREIIIPSTPTCFDANLNPIYDLHSFSPDEKPDCINTGFAVPPIRQMQFLWMKWDIPHIAVVGTGWPTDSIDAKFGANLMHEANHLATDGLGYVNKRNSADQDVLEGNLRYREAIMMLVANMTERRQFSEPIGDDHPLFWSEMIKEYQRTQRILHLLSHSIIDSVVQYPEELRGITEAINGRDNKTTGPNRRSRAPKGSRTNPQGGFLHRNERGASWWLHNSARYAQQR
jgi:hypothetical protein